jgi:hypothetical protein
MAVADNKDPACNPIIQNFLVALDLEPIAIDSIVKASGAAVG